MPTTSCNKDARNMVIGGLEKLLFGTLNGILAIDLNAKERYVCVDAHNMVNFLRELNKYFPGQVKSRTHPHLIASCCSV